MFKWFCVSCFCLGWVALGWLLGYDLDVGLFCLGGLWYGFLCLIVEFAWCVNVLICCFGLLVWFMCCVVSCCWWLVCLQCFFSWFMILMFGAAAFLVGLCFSGDIAFCAFGISCLPVDCGWWCRFLVGYWFEWFCFSFEVLGVVWGCLLRYGF